MSLLGRFLELSLPTPDIQASLGFYRALGFHELPTGDIRDYFYAVVTDGRVALGLHGQQLDVPALSFVHTDVATRARELEAGGMELEPRHLGVEEFNEVGFEDPDGNRILLLAAPTFSPATGAEVPSAAGRTSAVALPCRRMEATTGFWLSLGFIDDDSDDPDRVRLLAPGLVLELDTRLRGRLPLLRLRGADADTLTGACERAGIALQHDGNALLAEAPEGTRLLICPD